MYLAAVFEVPLGWRPARCHRFLLILAPNRTGSADLAQAYDHRKHCPKQRLEVREGSSAAREPSASALAETGRLPSLAGFVERMSGCVSGPLSAGLAVCPRRIEYLAGWPGLMLLGSRGGSLCWPRRLLRRTGYGGSRRDPALARKGTRKASEAARMRWSDHVGDFDFSKHRVVS